MRAKEEARFTPGPWSVGATGERGDGVWIQPADARANVICDIVGRLWDGEAEYTQITDEDLANARLIAASPDMLAALKDIFGFLRAHGYNTDLVRSVIAKAEGKE